MNRKLFLVPFVVLSGLLLVTGCGSEEEAVVAPPPPAPAAVSLTPTQDATVAPVLPTTPPDTGSAVAAISPGAGGEGQQDIFKGMTAEQIEEFKATTTPETHDMNFDPLQDAVNNFADKFKRAPANQEELVKARYLERVLQAPKGKRYVINPETWDVTTENL